MSGWNCVGKHKRNPLLTDILKMDTPDKISWCRGIKGNRIGICENCGATTTGLVYDWEVYFCYLEELMCDKCGWIDTKIDKNYSKILYPRLEFENNET